MVTVYSVKELMTPCPDTIHVGATLRLVLQRMKQDNCRQLPVLDDEQRLVGIITDRDVRLAMNSPLILRERWQDETLLDSLTAESCMTAEPVSVGPQTPAHEAAEMLATYKFGALPVVDGAELVGILSVTDILRAFVREQRERAGANQVVDV
ncbi:MAG: CBS domain-containing protein [Anaerolineae bacterium]|nr:CBS domain-containing protein [Anaerolineae bacterium]